MDTITRLRPPELVSSPFFSHAVVVPPGATMIHVGGQNAVDAEGVLVGGDDIAAQTTRAVRNAEVALVAAGATLADVISWTVLIVDGADLQAGAAAAGALILSPDQDPPLVTAAQVTALAVEGALVELAAIAAVVR